MILYLLVLIFTIVIALCGDVLAKGTSRIGWVTGSMLYMCTFIPHVWLYKRSNFATVALLWAPIGMLLTLVLSCGMYGEPLTPRKLLAAILAVAAILVYDFK